jgi:hypothetical protein
MGELFKPRAGVVLTPAPVRRNFETVDFGAPTGGRVRLVNGLCVAIVGGAVVFDLALALGLRVPPKSAWAMALAPLVGLVILVPAFLFSQIRGYRLHGGELLVVRRGRVDRFPLAGLQSAAADPAAMKFSLKIFGNDGLGAITGRFRNQRLGAYRALVTDRGRAVVLRWADRCLVVSPDQPAEFAEAVRVRANLNHG